MNIYVGNLSDEVTEEELCEEFTPFGEVKSVNIITDKNSGRSRGFAFVEMKSQAEGEAAIAGLKEKTLRDRTLDINEAAPRSQGRGHYSHGKKGGGSKRRSGHRRF
ncbi:MAG: RNA-binding protein [Dehalococcoidales bacterium]|nr:RNA-binding protein [Dehalococcoidales bacterium]